MTNEFPLPVARTVADLRATVRGWRKAGETVGFVPTMGALHEGHLSLIREAKTRADRVVASVFVNPKQFAAHEDLGTYPRQEGRDAELLAAEGCDLLFLPSVDEMYPQGAVTAVSVGGPAEGLESDFRPHFFGGVATVVAKLLNQVQADVAVFGDKDYQQLLVVRQMARDLDIPTEIVGAPTARDDEGLALSSRNAYLSPDQRDRAVALNLALAEAARRAARGEPIARVEADAAAAILEAGFDKIDYVSIRRADDLKPFPGGVAHGPGRVLAAAWIGKTRLIDNLAVAAG
ncbi:pantoate--beta-alanine ligase [Caulobacter sp. 17J65-9]|uniref:pantoate--beta-alanine ligase n=1 Tax=Caulobacter sp. 17J65-9 TaxID=2709382 RepID=UPI0013C7096F|nr:pantoate--beta-alanine ligase [Caulobacter sp. 17J65-9]NEX95256.1 pantoate--beta-alanine ligase [Caulobacter sp. 17J65-9]